MKCKHVLLSFTLLAVFAITQAQTETGESKFYVKINAGYGLLTPGSFKLLSTSYSGSMGNAALSKNGLGGGIRFGGGLGVIVSDFINIGADVEYLSGSKLSVDGSVRNPGGYDYFVHQEIAYHTLSITPHVIFKAVSKPDYLIYNKLGLLLNLPTELQKTQHDSSYSNNVADKLIENKSGTYKVGLTAGLNVALGVQMRLTDKLRGYAEVFGNYLIISPDTYDETNNYVHNDVPGTSFTKIKFIKSGALSNTSDGTTTNITTYVHNDIFNMNSIGINIGITYRF